MHVLQSYDAPVLQCSSTMYIVALLRAWHYTSYCPCVLLYVPLCMYKYYVCICIM